MIPNVYHHEMRPQEPPPVGRVVFQAAAWKVDTLDGVDLQNDAEPCSTGTLCDGADHH